MKVGYAGAVPSAATATQKGICTEYADRGGSDIVGSSTIARGAARVFAGALLFFFMQPLAESRAEPARLEQCRTENVLKGYVGDITAALSLPPYEKLNPKLRREVAEYGTALCSERQAKQQAMTRFEKSRERFISAARANGARDADLATVSADATRLVDQCVKLRSSVLRFHVPLELIARETIASLCFIALAHIFDSPDDVANIERVVPSRKQF